MNNDYEGAMAESYDAVYDSFRNPSGDREFYRSLAQASGGPVLELGCGTGRTLLPIAELGLECVGLDASSAMLSVFKKKALPPNLTLVEGTMEQFSLGAQRFKLITAPFRAFSHLLEVPAQLKALACIREHLAPGGVFAMDLFDPKLSRIAAEEEPESEDATVLHAGVQWKRFVSVRRNHTQQVMDVRFRFETSDGRSGESMVQLRWFYRYEVEHLLVRAGFSRVEIFGDFQRNSWNAGGETVVVAS